MKITAIIMAGGRGERFWPRSRNNMPKQFLSLTSDGETMLQKTISRIADLVEIEDVYIVTNLAYFDTVKSQLPEIPLENILTEPCSRNTAPCIGLAAAVIQKKYEDAIMIVLPSDHLIKSKRFFIDTLKDAISVAKTGENLVTLGITPTYPETGYGYIHFEQSENSRPGIYRAKKFVEKPCVQHAKEYLDSGEYLWNSGMFVWKASSIMNAITKFLPDMVEGLSKIKNSFGEPNFDKVLETEFPKFTSESIDFGVMEKADETMTIPCFFGWDDVGSWLALERINKTDEYGNTVQGDVVSINTKNSIISGNKKLIATVGVDNLIVIDTPDALLICAKDSTQDVKKVIENLKLCNRNELI